MKVIILTNFGMGLYKFRKELIQELVNRKYEVYISFPQDEYADKLTELGCTFIDTPVDRRGTHILKDLRLCLSYINILKRFKPDVVLSYTIKPNIYGGIAARLTKIPNIPNITGLGTSCEKKGVLQDLIMALYRIALSKAPCVFFQNESNRQYFVNKKIVNGKTRLIPGSGVNLNEFALVEYPKSDDCVNFLFIGRIMKAKGIDELLEAARTIKKNYKNVTFNLIGFLEEDYQEKLDEYERSEIISYHGFQDDVHFYLGNSHAVILPSYHEGTSNILLEAAATGRPVLASNIPGCKETFDEGISGFGFRVKDVTNLVDVLFKFIHLPYERKKEMGIAGRQKMEWQFDRRLVLNSYLKEMELAVKQNGI